MWSTDRSTHRPKVVGASIRQRAVPGRTLAQTAFTEQPAFVERDVWRPCHSWRGGGIDPQGFHGGD